MPKSKKAETKKDLLDITDSGDVQQKFEYSNADHLDKKTKQQQGSFYTPREIAIKMAKMLEWKPGQTILDPCVGSANLMVACMEVYPELTEDLLYGVDIDPEAIRMCIKKFPKGHWQVGDCLKDPITNDKFCAKDPFKLYFF